MLRLDLNEEIPWLKPNSAGNTRKWLQSDSTFQHLKFQNQRVQGPRFIIKKPALWIVPRQPLDLLIGKEMACL
ncbi:hypothetical protein T11_3116 [Trichinella zimbabwensis]|uniref:Uncharacterized protein n=1 Tax=Trichinella zimbabwensis TaxID=268475 RepID=A0A0V1GST2_9BILA|nr:hypothetical protein T11_3116 [Trichinella zimbabwensis]